MKRFNYFLYFNKVLISFGLFGFISPVAASTNNFICSPERSYLIRYKDRVSFEGLSTKNRSKYEENTKSAKKFKVSFDLKTNNSLIEGKPAKAIRIPDPKPYEYAPLFLYFTEDDLTNNDFEEFTNDFKESNFTSKSTLTTNSWNIRLDTPTKPFGPFYAIKSLKKIEESFKINHLDEVLEDILVEETILEVSEVFVVKLNENHQLILFSKSKNVYIF